jgi:ABC-type transporter lipoprotein component MlaA
MLNFPSQSKLLSRTSAVLLSVILAAMATGWASTSPHGESNQSDKDPLESVNRKIFSFNEGLDNAGQAEVLKC